MLFSAAFLRIALAAIIRLNENLEPQHLSRREKRNREAVTERKIEQIIMFRGGSKLMQIRWKLNKSPFNFVQAHRSTIFLAHGAQVSSYADFHKAKVHCLD